MSKHFKRMRGHYIALIIILVILIIPINWIYRIVQYRLGSEIGLLALASTVMVIAILGVRGAVHTHRIQVEVRKHLNAIKRQSRASQKPIVLQILGMDIPPPSTAPPIADIPKSAEEQELQSLLSMPRKRRGKQSRYSEEKIWKTVLKWEKRDPSFSARTLEEFLEQEFGCGSDGILLVAPSTFYDWRRHVLKEIREQQFDPSLKPDT